MSDVNRRVVINTGELARTAVGRGLLRRNAYVPVEDADAFHP